MIEVKLQYLGKKSPLKLTNKQLSRQYVFGTEPVWVRQPDFVWLKSINPNMFAKLDQRSEIVEEPAEEVAEPVISEPEFIEKPIVEVLPEEPKKERPKRRYTRRVQKYGADE